MTTPFLSTKFYIPHPRKRLVRRERLFDMLDEGIHGKLILVSAPAGYGKTTLISSWLAIHELPVAWISVDAGDNEYYRFFSYLLESLHQKESQVGETLLQMLQSPMPPSQDTLISLFLNEISKITRDCILVIDDYHMIYNPTIHTALWQMIEGSPKELHFIICSRTELPFSVSRFRSTGELLEITQKELSLTLDESALYMNLVMGVGLQPVDVAVLHNRTEGWPAGLQLVALSLRGQTDPVGFIHSLKGDNRYIGDYLVDEVLLRVPVDLQDFLLRTSLLSRMESSLCNYVLQIENSQELLESVDKKRLFIVSLDDNRCWFRYHLLFGEMLYTRLVRKSPEIIAGLYQRASAWHAAHGMKEEAIDYALDGNDYAKAMDLINEVRINLLSRGSWHQLLNWYSRIPETKLLDYRDLWLTYFVALINAGLISTAAEKLNEIKNKYLKIQRFSHEALKRVNVELAAVQGVINLHFVTDLLEARELLKEARRYLSDNENRDIFATFNYGVSCLVLGELEEAQGAFEETIAWGKKEDFSLLAVMGNSYLAETLAMTGSLWKAHGLFQDTVEYVNRVGLQQSAVFSKANLGLGSLYYEWNKLDDALQFFTEGIRLAEQGGYLDQLLPAYAALAHIQNLEGDLEGVQETIYRARRMAEKYDNPPIATSFINAIEANHAQEQGTFLVVDNWLASLKNNPLDIANLFSQYEQATLARVLAAKGDYETFSKVIGSIRELAFKQGRMKDVISCDVIAARCLFMRGEPSQAMTVLQGALFAAEPGRFVRTFLDEGGLVISMIKQLLARDECDKSNFEEASADYLYYLLDEVAKDTLKVPAGHPLQKSAEGLEPLTDHELRILDLLEIGYSNKQIAQEFSVSVNTVKFHLKNIYRKLGVVNRTQAARAIRK